MYWEEYTFKVSMRINIDHYELISLDIFDTLLLRAVAKPIDIFQIVWNKVKEKEVYLSDLSENEFMKLRIELERRARKKKEHREVNLDDIYNEIPAYIVSDVNELKQIEIEVEKEYCYSNFDIYELVKEAAGKKKKIVLVSDMYLTSQQIKSLLEHNGIDIKYFDTVIVSNERKCSKQSGKLYNALFEEYPNVPKQKILHIGDNKNSDYNQAIQAGIHAIHYDAIPEKLNSIYDFEKIRHNIPQKGLLSLRKVVSYQFTQDLISETEKRTYELGSSIAGPFLTLYISHVCNRLQKLKIKRIYPLMREGYLLGELLKREAKNRNMDLLVKPIYVSRKVTYIPSIEKVDREEIENIIGVRNLTLLEAINNLGLSQQDFNELNEYFGEHIKKSHKIKYSEHQTLKEYFIHRLLEKQNVERIENYVQQEREKLVTYLVQEIGDLQNIAFIDIGFFGRMQEWIDKALTMSCIPHKIKTFFGAGVVGEKFYNGIDIEGYCGTFAENGDIIPALNRTPDVLEKMISVTEGSTIGYCEENDKIIPIKGEGVNNNEFLDIVFKGIYDFQTYWHKFESKKPHIAKQCVKNRKEALMILHRLIDMPRKSEVEVLAGVEADTNFGTNYFEKIIIDRDIKLIQEKGADFIDRCTISYTYENNFVVWPKGVVTLIDEFYYVRKIMKNLNTNEVLKSMQEVVEKIKDDGIRDVALYGAGENGRQFYFMCCLYNIKVNCFIDRKESLWGTRKEGIEIVGLKEAMKRGNKDFIVTSLFSISEIKDYIEEMFEGVEGTARIYTV